MGEGRGPFRGLEREPLALFGSYRGCWELAASQSWANKTLGNWQTVRGHGSTCLASKGRRDFERLVMAGYPEVECTSQGRIDNYRQNGDESTGWGMNHKYG